MRAEWRAWGVGVLLVGSLLMGRPAGAADEAHPFCFATADPPWPEEVIGLDSVRGSHHISCTFEVDRIVIRGRLLRDGSLADKRVIRCDGPVYSCRAFTVRVNPDGLQRWRVTTGGRYLWRGQWHWIGVDRSARVLL